MTKNRLGQELCASCNSNLPVFGEELCGRCAASQEREDEWSEKLSLLRLQSSLVGGAAEALDLIADLLEMLKRDG